MGIFNSLTFDNENSLDYGIYISGEGAYNAPERAVEKVSIPGRNGDLIIDQGKFENIDVTYPAGVFGATQTEMAEKLRAFRNVLASRYSYVRLMDSYHSDEFRLAMFREGLEAKPVSMNRGSEFEIVFDCKPQRFLVSGETPVSYPRAWGQTETATGNPAEFEADASTGIKSLQVALEPIQDLNGYDRPWVGGAGKNLLENTATTTTKQGLTYTVNSDGSVTVNGTATANSYLAIPVDKSFASAVIVNGCPTPVQSGVYIQAVDSDSTTYDDTGNGVTVPSGKTLTYVRCRINNGVTVSNKTFYPMIRLASVSDATFEPYSNICPISGHASVETHRTGRNLLENTASTTTKQGLTYTVNSDGSVTVNGTATANSYLAIPVDKSFASAVIVNGCPTPVQSGVFVQAVDSDGTTYADTGNGVTVPSGKTITYVWCRINNGVTVSNKTFYPMIRLATDTDSTYEPYQGETYTTDLGRTVYGGTLDLVSGVLTVDRAYSTITSDMNINSVGTHGWYVGRSSIAPTNTGANYSDGVVSDKLKTEIGSSSVADNLIFVNSSGQIRINTIDTYSSASAMLTALGGSVNVAYPVPTQTYQLTPQEVEALVGSNVVWSDGDVSVQYGEDPEKIVNPTLFPSNPLIALTGSGTVTIGDTTITSTAPTGTTVYIDCESKEIYYYLNGALTNGSGFITLTNHEFPVIPAGVTKIESTIVGGVTVTPRWWIL